MTCPANPDIIQVPWEFEEGPNAPKVQKFGSDDNQFATFRIKTEDHTLGNALRYVLSTNRSVDITAYAIPHPHTDAMNLRIQAKTGHDATELLSDGCRTLQKICKHVNNVYIDALNRYDGTDKATVAMDDDTDVKMADNDSDDSSSDNDGGSGSDNAKSQAKAPKSKPKAKQKSQKMSDDSDQNSDSSSSSD